MVLKKSLKIVNCFLSCFVCCFQITVPEVKGGYCLIEMQSWRGAKDARDSLNGVRVHGEKLAIFLVSHCLFLMCWGMNRDDWFFLCFGGRKLLICCILF